jgi:hypothetical protein
MYKMHVKRAYGDENHAKEFSSFVAFLCHFVQVFFREIFYMTVRGLRGQMWHI